MHHSTTTEGEDLPRSDYSNIGIERNHSPSNSDWLLGNQPLPLFYNFQPLSSHTTLSREADVDAPPQIRIIKAFLYLCSIYPFCVSKSIYSVIGSLDT